MQELIELLMKCCERNCDKNSECDKCELHHYDDDTILEWIAKLECDKP